MPRTSRSTLPPGISPDDDLVSSAEYREFEKLTSTGAKVDFLSQLVVQLQAEKAILGKQVVEVKSEAVETSSKLLTMEAMIDKLREDFNGRLRELETANKNSDEEIRGLKDELKQARGLIGQNTRGVSQLTWQTDRVEARMEALEKTAFQDDTYADRLDKLEAQSRDSIQAKPGFLGENEAREQTQEAEPSAAGQQETTSAADVTLATGATAAVALPTGAAAAAFIKHAHPAVGATTSNVTAAEAPAPQPPAVTSAEHTHPASHAVSSAAPSSDPSSMTPAETLTPQPPAVTPSEQTHPASHLISSPAPSTAVPNTHISPPSLIVASTPTSTYPAADPTEPSSHPTTKTPTPILPADDPSAYAAPETTEPSSHPQAAPLKSVRSRGRTPNAGIITDGPRTRSRASTPQANSSHATSATSRAGPKSQASKSNVSGPASVPLASVTEESSGAGDMDLEQSESEDAMAVVV